MDTDPFITINDRLSIPMQAIELQFVRGSGPGGQNVNKVETAVELIFDLQSSPLLTETQRALARSRLGQYLDSSGVLRLVAQSERSQLRNREEVLRRFAQLLREALIPPKHRRPTKPSRAAKERRLESKRKAGAVKQGRRVRED